MFHNRTVHGNGNRTTVKIVIIDATDMISFAQRDYSGLKSLARAPMHDLRENDGIDFTGNMPPNVIIGYKECTCCRKFGMEKLASNVVGAVHFITSQYDSSSLAGSTS